MKKYKKIIEQEEKLTLYLYMTIFLIIGFLFSIIQKNFWFAFFSLIITFWGLGIIFLVDYYDDK